MKYSHIVINQDQHFPYSGIMTKSQIYSPTEKINVNIHRKYIIKDISAHKMEPAFLKINLTDTPGKMTHALMQCPSFQ